MFSFQNPASRHRFESVEKNLWCAACLLYTSSVSDCSKCIGRFDSKLCFIDTDYRVLYAKCPCASVCDGRATSKRWNGTDCIVEKQSAVSYTHLDVYKRQCTSNTQRLSAQWDAVHSFHHGMKEAV